MPVDVVCSCGKKFRAADHHAGREFDCPVCGQSLEVPDSTGGPQSTSFVPSSASDDLASIMPGIVWQLVVDGVSSLLSGDKLSALARFSGRAGLHCMTALMILIPLLLIVMAIKGESVGPALVAVGVVVVLSLGQYLNDRFLRVIFRQLHASQARTTSSVLFDVMSLVCFVSAIGTFCFSGYSAIKFSQWEAFVLGGPIVLFLVACGFVALNPEFLAIRIDATATTGDDILTIVSLPFKLLLSITPFVFLSFGLAVLVQTVLAIVAVLVADDSGLPMVMASSEVISMEAVYIGLVPLASYLVAAQGLFMISVSGAILAVPPKLDAIRHTLED